MTGRPVTSRPSSTSHSVRSWGSRSRRRYRHGWSPRRRWSRTSCRGLAAEQEPKPLEYLQGDQRVPDLRFSIDLNDERISEVDLAGALYWTPAQQLAHLTVNGAVARAGDLIASGTISGEDHMTQAGSLIERSWRTSFLDDGDVVTIRGWAGEGEHRVGFGSLVGDVGG